LTLTEARTRNNHFDLFRSTSFELKLDGAKIGFGVDNDVFGVSIALNFKQFVGQKKTENMM